MPRRSRNGGASAICYTVIVKKILTLVLVNRGENLLLGMKKRGFGEGRWNGFGGKVEAGETILQAARRELKEEVGIEAGELSKVAILTFSFSSDETLVLEVHVFRADTFTGEPVETEEMKPQWFPYESVPYDDMWPDDTYWLPKVLENKLVEGLFHFDAPASPTHLTTILSYQVSEVEELQDGVY
jgi:8-oxo-dGTP diphosphatase / 2-hydroxy-dATP diphosphatase